jgi:hypothetical protein
MLPLEDEGGEAVSVALPETDAVSVDLPDGGALVSFGDSLVSDVGFSDNLAEHMDPRALTALASDLLAAVEADEQSRADWKAQYIKGLDLLGLKIEDRSTPWPGACGVYHPILTEAAVRFQHRPSWKCGPPVARPRRAGRQGRRQEDAPGRAGRD